MYVLKRLIYVAVTIFLVLSFNFLLFRVMPADVTRILIPKGASNETIERLTEFYGLDDPLPVQYVVFLKQTFTGDFGESISYLKGEKVSSIITTYTAKTLMLAGIGTILSIFFGVILGRETAWRRGKMFDRVGSSFFLVFYCMPTFLTALLILTMSVKVLPDWPIKGEYSADYQQLDILGKLADRGQHLILPMFALVIETLTTFSIITRSSLVDVLTEEYMVTAVAKGLRSKDILKHHAMPNAMLPVVTVVAMNVGWILSGAIMVEVIFSYQGLGYLTYRAVLDYDYPLIQVAFMLEAVAVIIANFIADLALFALDPRVKI
jgi:peptide/nickel transport system permease protein